MSTLDAPTRVSSRQNRREEASLPFYLRAWDYAYHNQGVVYGVLVAILLLIGGAVGYAYYQSQQGEKAQQLLGQIAPLYENGNYEQALQGTEETPGLLTIAEEYGGTQAGNLARYYAADALYQQGEYDRALQFFEAYEKEENYLGASAFAGEAAIYENKEQYEEAGDAYRRAASFYENERTSPEYLLQAGQAYTEAGAYEKAREAYQMIEERYPESEEAQDVEMYLARLEAQAQEG